MRVIRGTDINQIFDQAMSLIVREGLHRDSRNGPVLEHPDAVTTVYDDPRKHVLFHQERDANPFFHLFESLWMINGGSDARSLNYFISDFGSRFSDDGKFIRGSAYGQRWRFWFHEDQLARCVKALKENPDDRRQVLTMWDPYTDISAAKADSRDVPCNLVCHVYLRNGKLDLTVFNRSNDVIFGCYGGNAVHFSMILEYLSEQIGVPMGKYTQVSDSWHLYTEYPVSKRLLGPWKLTHMEFADKTWEKTTLVDYRYFNVTTMGSQQEGWHEVLEIFCAFFASPARDRRMPYLSELERFSTTVKSGQAFTFWRCVVFPMMSAWVAWKSSKNAQLALSVLDIEMKNADSDEHNDWLNAATMWLKRRIK